MNRILDFIITFDSREIVEFNGKKGYWITHFGHKIFIPEGTKEEKRKAIKEYFKNVKKYNNVQKKYFEPSDKDKKNYEEKFEVALNPRLPYDNEKSNKAIRLKICDMPYIYKKIGLKDKEINMTRFAILKDLHLIPYKHEHWVEEETLKNLPNLISDPVMVIEDYNEKQKNNCYISILNAKDKNKKQMIAYLSPSKINNGYTLVLSAYGIDDEIENKIEKGIENKKVKYINKKMSDGVVRSLKSAIISPSDTNSIIEKEEIVNSFMENEKVSEDEIKEEISSFVLDCLDIKDNINQKTSYLKGYFVALDKINQGDISFSRYMEGAVNG